MTLGGARGKLSPTVYQVSRRSFLFFRNPRPDAVDPDTGKRYTDVIGGRRRRWQALTGSVSKGLAGPTGFEPAISSVTGWHVWPLHHGPAQSDGGGA